MHDTYSPASLQVDVDHLKRMEQQALVDRDQAEAKFKAWASKFCADAIYMNVSSGATIGSPNTDI